MWRGAGWDNVYLKDMMDYADQRYMDDDSWCIRIDMK
jgi:hypothetical protein